MPTAAPVAPSDGSPVLEPLLRMPNSPAGEFVSLNEAVAP